MSDMVTLVNSRINPPKEEGLEGCTEVTAARIANVT